MVVTTSVGAPLHTRTKADEELLTPEAIVSTTVVCTMTKSTSEEEATKNPEEEEPSTENRVKGASKKCLRGLMAALESELPLLEEAADPAATERCRLILKSLLKAVFLDPMQSSRLRRVKKLRNHSKLGKLANRVIMYWFLDRETRQWRQALDKSDLSKVQAKVAFFYLQVEKHCCLSVELMDRLSLRSLVEDSAALFQSSGHRDAGFLERLKRLTDLQY